MVLKLKIGLKEKIVVIDIGYSSAKVIEAVISSKGIEIIKSIKIPDMSKYHGDNSLVGIKELVAKITSEMQLACIDGKKIRLPKRTVLRKPNLSDRAPPI